MGKYTVNIRTFGAESQSADCRRAIQDAIDDCFLHGGGEVRIPAGRWFTGGIRLRSGVTLYLEAGAELIGLRDPEAYMGFLHDTVEPLEELGTERSGKRMANYYSRWNNAIIRALFAENIAIIGEPGSSINGQNCADPSGEEGYRGPHAISMHGCRNVTLRGYTVIDSANWAHAIFDTANIDADTVSVRAGHDGIHVRGCDNVRIVNCDFRTGDDCIAGYDNQNVLVKNCYINSSCSGMRFGGTNVTVLGCRFVGPGEYCHRYTLTKEEQLSGAPSRDTARHNMKSAFTYFADHSHEIREQPGRILLRDCSVENTDLFFHFNFSGNEAWQSSRPLESICFENVRAEGIRMPLNAYGSDEVPLTLEMRNVHFSFDEGFDNQTFMRACHFRRIHLENMTIRGLGEAPLITSWSDGGEVLLRALKPELSEAQIRQPATEEFYAEPV